MNFVPCDVKQNKKNLESVQTDLSLKVTSPISGGTTLSDCVGFSEKAATFAFVWSNGSIDGRSVTSARSFCSQFPPSRASLASTSTMQWIAIQLDRFCDSHGARRGERLDL